MKNSLRQIVVLFFLFFLSAVSRSQIASVEIKNGWIHLNTKDSTYAEDEKERKTKIYFTEEDQKKIIQLADSFFFWQMPENPQAGYAVLPCPGITTFHIKTKEHEKTIRFYCSFEKITERDNIRGLEFAILDIVYKKPEYLALPPRRMFHQ